MKNNEIIIQDFNHLAHLLDFEEWEKFESSREGRSYYCVYINSQKVIVENRFYEYFFLNFEEGLEELIEKNKIQPSSEPYIREFCSINQWFYYYQKNEISIKSQNIAQQKLKDLFFAQSKEPTVNIIIPLSNSQTLGLYDVPKSWCLPFYIPMPKDKDYYVQNHIFFVLFCLSKKRLKKFLDCYEQYEIIRKEIVKAICQDIDDKVEYLQLNSKYSLNNKNIELDDYFKFYQQIDVNTVYSHIKKENIKRIFLKIDLLKLQKYAIFLSILILIFALVLEFIVKVDYLSFWFWFIFTWFLGLIGGVRVLEVLHKYLVNRNMKKLLWYLPARSADFLYWQSFWDWKQKTMLIILCSSSVYILWGRYF